MRNRASVRSVHFPMRALGAAIVLTLILVGVAAVNTWRMYSGFRQLVSTDVRLQQLAGQIVHLDEVLTMSARLAATSGDLSWEVRYKKNEPLLTAAINEARALAPEAKVDAGNLAKVDAVNLALVDLETRSFDLVRANRLAEARALMFGDEYARQKEIYDHGMAATMAAMRDRLEARTDSHSAGVRASLLVALVILVGVGLGWASVIRLMRRYLRERNTALDDLQIANDTLELRVDERTTELSVSLQQLGEAQDQVVATARAAGMAEVAAGVLHNVGNVLNSINVSVQVIEDALKGCRVSSVRKAADMLTAAKADLPAFLATEKGQLLGAYLCEATVNVAAMHDRAGAELEHLRNGVEHVKAIVSTQQTYAHATVHVDTFELSELVAGAIRLSASSMAESSVEVANRVDAALSMTTDKHRLTQILVNLINNAKQATGESPEGALPIEIDAAVSTTGCVQIQVRDHGIGIDAQTMKRLFDYGFTTKKSGHGFGLHSSAIAAGDLGGTIRAESDGISHGATFVLELPTPGPPRAEVNRAA